MPTKKWIAALVTGLFTVGLHAVASGGWDATESGELLTLGIALAGAWIKTNDPTPGGVPPKGSVSF